MVPASVNRISYVGNGISTAFSFPFKILDASDVKLLLTDPNGVESAVTSDYYVDVNASIVYYPGYAPGAEEPEAEQPPILPVGWQLTLYREVPITQDSRMDEHWPFKQIEDMVDKSRIIEQQLNDAVGRALKISVARSISVDTMIPWAAGMSFRISDDGLRLEPTEDPARVLPMAQVILAQTAAARDALLLRPGYLAVEGDLENIDAVANDLDNIDAAVENIADIHSVGSNINKVVAVADDLTAIAGVYNDLTNIDNVWGIHTDIGTVATNILKIVSVANIAADVSNVSAIRSQVTTVATNITNVNAVADNATNINAVKNNATNINAVAGNKTNIDSVATNIQDIKDVANDLQNIDAASANAALSKQYAIGEPTEPPEGSAKYWAEQCDVLLNSKVDKTTTVNGHALSGNVTISKSDVGLGNVDNTSDTTLKTSTDFCGGEKVASISGGAINLSNGRVFYCTGSSITMPTTVINGVCVTLIFADTVASNNFGSDSTYHYKWKGGSAPEFESGSYNVVTFVGCNGYWVGG